MAQMRGYNYVKNEDTVLPSHQTIRKALYAATCTLFVHGVGEDVTQILPFKGGLQGVISGDVNETHYEIQIACTPKVTRDKLKRAVDAAVNAMLNEAEADESQELGYLREYANELHAAFYHPHRD